MKEIKRRRGEVQTSYLMYDFNMLDGEIETVSRASTACVDITALLTLAEFDFIRISYVAVRTDISGNMRFGRNISNRMTFGYTFEVSG